MLQALFNFVHPAIARLEAFHIQPDVQSGLAQMTSQFLGGWGVVAARHRPGDREEGEGGELEDVLFQF